MTAARVVTARVAELLAPRRLIATANATLILYLLEVFLSLSVAALIFAGPLASELPRAAPYALAGIALLIATVALFSSYQGAIASAQSGPGVILAAAAASIAAAPPALDGSVFPTVIALIALSSLAMGASFSLLGAFRVGQLVRFLPYPVMGGFLAATGWLLVVGGVGVSSNVALGAALFETDTVNRWAPALALGAAMWFAARRWQSSLVLALGCLSALALFYVTAWALGTSPAVLADAGWLVGSSTHGSAWQSPWSDAMLTRVDWNALAEALPIAAPAILIGVIGLLLNASGLELVIRRDIDLNRELRANGFANLASGLAGGPIGFTAISFSALANSLGAGSRVPGLAVALLLAVTAVAGNALLAWIPRLLMGALLIYIGLALLHEWVIRARTTLPRTDYAVVLAILVIVALKDFVWGVGLGLVAAIAMFIVNYSRIDIVRNELSGAIYRSRVNRSPGHFELLQARGTELAIFQLHGFIFFGTANNLFERIRDRVRHAQEHPTRFVLLDFEHVSGLDSTALMSFEKLAQLARENAIEVVATGLVGGVGDSAARAGFDLRQPSWRMFPDIDRGVEWCEERIIEAAGSTSDGGPAGELRRLFADPAQLATLLRHMTRRELAVGEILIRQGDKPDHLFLVESGQLTALLERPGREPLRLESMQGGRMVGELGFFLGTQRSAAIVADRASVVYQLTREQWDRMGELDPEAVRALHVIAISLLSQRVSHLMRAIDALQK